jgi:signal transduction histidine kinase/ligand-binding sensor domain-containing protein
MTEGLPGDQVENIFMDKAGVLWLDIWGHGLVRYDGRRASVIKKINKGSTSVIFILGSDQEGNLWTNQGVYNGRTILRSGMIDSIYRHRPHHMVEDAQGTKWFTNTQGSILKFSHDKLELLSHKDGFAGNYIYSLYADQRNNLWIGTDTYLNRYNGNYFDTIPQRKGLVEGIVWSTCEDRKGNVWFATTKGLVKYDGKQFVTFTEKDSLPSNQTWSVTADADDNIWVGTDNGLCKYDGRKFHALGKVYGVSGRVNKVVADPVDGVWFWSFDIAGLMHFAGDAISMFWGNTGLEENSVNAESLIISAMLADSAGHYWLGGQGFAYYYDGNAFTYYGKEQGLLAYGSERAVVTAIIRDRSGKTWFGMNGGNISVFDGKSFTHITGFQGTGGRFIQDLHQDRAGRIWGTISDHDPASPKIFCIDGNSIFGYGENHGVIGGIINDIFEDSRGNFWFCSAEGVCFFNGKRFINFNYSSGLAASRTFRIAEDNYGNILIATAGGLSVIRKEKLHALDSLVKQRPYQDIFENYTVKEGLSGNLVQDVLVASGNIFVGTDFGLTVLRDGLGKPGEGLPKNRIEYFNLENGYPIPYVYRIFRDPEDVIWINSSTNFFRFDYKRLNKAAKPPPVNIQGIRLHDETISWYNLSQASVKNPKYNSNSTDIPVLTTEELTLYGATLTEDERRRMVSRFSGILFDSIVPFLNIPFNLRLPYRHNNIQIDYAANAPARPENIRYQYMLEGQDSTWGNVTEKSSVSFSSLQEGNYRFLVRSMALSPNSPWSEPVVYAFEVLPPWYRTWWAYLLYVVGFVALVTAVVRWRIAALKKDKLRLEHQVMQRTQELVVAKEQVEESLAELKTTQQELIQREKMASLGELTAGIAHEIQNPLNFVNNFTEVNRELIVELREEIKTGNLPEVEAIVNDIDSNEEKILLHGKRAGAIVKSMLEHSRAGSGKKEPTDINALADEYIRLAFHGMRAKDKTFHAALHTDFDASLEKVNVIPQDIGRVLLNLVNNAFYAVHEKKQSAPDGYEPAVFISTEKKDSKLVITVKDNGNGIPDKIKDKIFQPFFTTKPTGKGTGLGLSLSYDIVKAHGGEIKAETKEGAGSEFNIQLPV